MKFQVRVLTVLFFFWEVSDIYNSITFTNADGFVYPGESKTISLYTDYGLVPESRPLVNPPEVRTEYVDIPGADGSLDYTEALSGIRYKNREGSWTFYVTNSLFGHGRVYYAWNDIYSDLMRYLHGKRKRIELESDPYYYYYGRVFVDSWNSNKDYSKITLKYNLDPYKEPKYTTGHSSSSPWYEWKWNSLFGINIYYGKFKVSDIMYRDFFNYTENDIVPLELEYGSVGNKVEENDPLLKVEWCSKGSDLLWVDATDTYMIEDIDLSFDKSVTLLVHNKVADRKKTGEELGMILRPGHNWFRFTKLQEDALDPTVYFDYDLGKRL